MCSIEMIGESSSDRSYDSIIEEDVEVETEVVDGNDDIIL